MNISQLLNDLKLGYDRDRIGVYGELVTVDYILKDGDRVELYLPLKVDPKEKRRRLVEHKRRKNKCD